MTFSWLFHDFLMTFLWLSQDFLRIFSEHSQDFLRTFVRLSQDFLKTFPGMSQDIIRIFQDFLRMDFNFLLQVLALIVFPCFPYFPYLLSSQYSVLYSLLHLLSCQTWIIPCQSCCCNDTYRKLCDYTALNVLKKARRLQLRNN